MASSSNQFKLKPYYTPHYYYQLAEASYVDNAQNYLNVHLPQVTAVAAETFNGWRVVLFRDKETDELSVGFRGTTMTSLSNWRDNATHHFIGWSPNITAMTRRIENWATEHGPIGHFTGHSAGGFFATHIKREWKVLRITFNGHLCSRKKRQINLRTGQDVVTGQLSQEEHYFTVGDGGHSLADFKPLLPPNRSWDDLLSHQAEFVASPPPQKVADLELALSSCMQINELALTQFEAETAELRTVLNRKEIEFECQRLKSSKVARRMHEQIAVDSYFVLLNERLRLFRASGAVACYRKDETHDSRLLESYLTELESLLKDSYSYRHKMPARIPPALMTACPDKFTSDFSTAEEAVPIAYLFAELGRSLLVVTERTDVEKLESPHRERILKLVENTLVGIDQLKLLEPRGPALVGQVFDRIKALIETREARVKAAQELQEKHQAALEAGCSLTATYVKGQSKRTLRSCSTYDRLEEDYQKLLTIARWSKGVQDSSDLVRMLDSLGLKTPQHWVASSSCDELPQLRKQVELFYQMLPRSSSLAELGNIHKKLQQIINK